jgi:hypothetical protein
MRAHGITLRRFLRAALVVVVVFGVSAPMSASAQVPPVELPPEVDQGLDVVLQTVLPVVNDGAAAAGPAANATGFALRPVCSVATASTLVLVLAGTVAPLPISPLTLAAAPLILCGYAFEPGPADPVLKDVDGAVGPTAQSTLAPVLQQISAGLDPVKPELADACGVANLLGSASEQMPPPLHRFDVIKVLCGGSE